MHLRSRVALLLPFLFFSPYWSATTARADDLNLDAYKGKVVYLDFWASWCAHADCHFPG